ncbi:MAG: hypothetical protein ACTHJH_07930, partial [Marmoricola sp.]
MNHSEEELQRDLARGAGVFEARGGRERTMAEVLGTARTIRRRRQAGAALVAAAVVAAVAVPVTVGSAHRSAAPPPASSVTPRPIERIALGGLPIGPAPAAGWVRGTTWHDGSGHRQPVVRNLPADDHVTGAALSGDALVATLSTADGSRAVLLRSGRDATALGPTSGGLAASSSPGRVAFVTPDGKRVTVVSDGGRSVRTLTAPGIGEGALQP